MTEAKKAIYYKLIKEKRDDTDWENPEEVKKYYEFTKNIRNSILKEKY